MRGIFRGIVLSVSGALVLAAPMAEFRTAHAQMAAQPEETEAWTDRKPVRAERFMAVAANPHAAEAGLEVLKAGGSAADAAVAVQLVLNVVEPQSSGIGGGAFTLYWDAEAGRLEGLDGRETAPAAATPGYWMKLDGEPLGWWHAVVGGRSVGVPGTLKLLEELHRRHGRLAWSDLFEPAIRLAEEGFEISPRLAASIARAKGRNLALFPAARAYFFEPDGAPKPAGTLLKSPALADTLRLLAAEGSAPFYEGGIAEDIVEAIRTPVNPGIMTRADLAAYEVIERQPVCIRYRRFEICGMAPPAGGPVVAQIMGLLEPHDMPTLGNSPEGWHRYIEAAKLAYADRALYMADPDFFPVPLEGLLEPGYLSERSGLILPDQSMGKAEAGDPPRKQGNLLSPMLGIERPGTTHFVIRDGDGNALSMTSSIETGFGSRVMVGGFLLNNELTDFSFRPVQDGRAVANRVEGGKRPRSSMSPTIVLEDGKPVLLVGSPGGSRIINYVAKTLVAILDWEMDPQEAISLGHVVNRNGSTDLEEGTGAAELKASLEAMGHEVAVGNLNSGLHVIQIGSDGLVGGADPRREGLALGE